MINLIKYHLNTVFLNRANIHKSFSAQYKTGLLYVSLTFLVSCEVATYWHIRVPNRLSDRSQSSHSIDWRDICSDDKIHCTTDAWRPSADRSLNGIWSIRLTSIETGFISHQIRHSITREFVHGMLLEKAFLDAKK